MGVPSTKVYYSSEGKDEEGNELGYKTLGHLRKVNFNDKNLFIEYLLNRLGYVTESYFSNKITKITFTYIIKDGLTKDNAKSFYDETVLHPFNHKFNRLVLPVSMNPSDYGTIEVQNFVQSKGESFERFIVTKGSKTFRIDVNKDLGVNNVQMLGNTSLSWTDTNLNDGLFKREIEKSIIYFCNGEIVLRKKLITCKSFTKVAQSKDIHHKFTTLDIETIRVRNKHVPYLICAHNGNDSFNTFANYTFENGIPVLDQKDLFLRFIKQLCSFFESGKSVLYVYAHNFSKFDGIFILKHLISLGKVKPLIFNGKLISIKIKLNIEGFVGKTIIFKDSMLLLPKDLKSLCTSYGVPSKTNFPYLLNDTNYIGTLPHHLYWPGISELDYSNLAKEFQNKVWSFKDESIKYCIQDCIALHQVLVKFNELIFNEFKVNIQDVLTLPSLAMRIYKSGYMPDNTLYQLLGPAEKDIRNSYTGGAVDVFIPRFNSNLTEKELKNKCLPGPVGNILPGQLMFAYDVNALYPFVMANAPMPVGKPIAFTGDIRAIDSKAFGFFYCEITSPDYLEHPVLQRKIKTSQGFRTIAGLGTWKGWIFSGEMDNAINRFGYQFKIIKGYEFEIGYPFKSYLYRMYDLRMKYPKGDPMNDSAKLLQNALYGKFGMKPEGTVIDMFDTNDQDQVDILNGMLDAYGQSVQDFVKIDNYLITVRDNISQYKYTEEIDMFHGVDVNIAVASAVTANGRMWMSFFKNNSDYKLYYSDTDSYFFNRSLPAEYVGSNIGQLKLEHIIVDAIFLAPKVYAFKTIEGKEIVKIKGITQDTKSDINFAMVESLLVKDSSKEFNQEKWFKKTLEGDITVSELAYTLKATSNKRMPIYNKGIFVGTKPYNYDDIIIDNNK